MSRWTAPLQALAKTRAISKSPVPLASRTTSRSIFAYSPTQDMYGYLEAYGNDPVVRPIVARLFQGVSALNWRLFVKSKAGDDNDRQEVTKHPVLDFLAHPNDFQTWAEIVARGQQHWELVGETSLVLGFQPGIKYPIDTWVLRPDRINPIPDAYQFLAGWIYTAPGDGERIPLATNELLRMVDPSPTDPYRGMGAVQALARDLDATRLTKEWQAEFFANSAQPSGVIEADHRLDDAEFEEFTTRWAEQHQGVSKAHRVAVLENMTWTQNSFSLRDLQLAELDGLSRDKVLAAFGMPKSMIGVVEDVNRANAEAGEYLFQADMVKPRANNWKSMLNHQLLPLFDPSGTLELDFDDPVPENSEANVAELKTKADVLTELVAAGFDSAEVLEFIDWPDLKYTKPEVSLPPGQGDFGEGLNAPLQTPDDTPKNREIIRIKSVLGAPVDNAMRWVVRGHPDDHCCEPCLSNIGKLYRNRSSAYEDYPPGEGYVNCVGAQFGNHCRCHVAKRRSQRDE